MAFHSFVLDEEGLDRVDRPDVAPFVAAPRFRRLVVTAVIAFDGPVFHQHRLAVRKAHRFGIAADNLGKQATRASIAVFIMFSTVHHGNAGNAKAPKRDLARGCKCLFLSLAGSGLSDMASGALS